MATYPGLSSIACFVPGIGININAPLSQKWPCLDNHFVVTYSQEIHEYL